MGDPSGAENFADRGLDLLVAETLPVGLRLPDIDVAEASITAQDHMTHEPLGGLGTELGSDLAVHRLIGGHVLNESVRHV